MTNINEALTRYNADDSVLLDMTRVSDNADRYLREAGASDDIRSSLIGILSEHELLMLREFPFQQIAELSRDAARCVARAVEKELARDLRDGAIYYLEQNAVHKAIEHLFTHQTGTVMRRKDDDTVMRSHL